MMILRNTYRIYIYSKPYHLLFGKRIISYNVLAIRVQPVINSSAHIRAKLDEVVLNLNVNKIIYIKPQLTIISIPDHKYISCIIIENKTSVVFRTHDKRRIALIFSKNK